MGGWTWLISMCIVSNLSLLIQVLYSPASQGIYVVVKERKQAKQQTKSDNHGNVSGLITQTSDTPIEKYAFSLSEEHLCIQQTVRLTIAPAP